MICSAAHFALQQPGQQTCGQRLRLRRHIASHIPVHEPVRRELQPRRAQLRLHARRGHAWSNQRAGQHTSRLAPGSGFYSETHTQALDGRQALALHVHAVV